MRLSASWIHTLRECGTLWGEHWQVACTLALKRMRCQTLLSVNRVTIVVVSLWWHIVTTSLAGMDCHVSITVQPFLPRLLCCSLILSSDAFQQHVTCETRVYSWNTYPACLFALPDTPDWFRVHLHFRMHIVDLLTLNTTWDFGAKELIIGSSWNNGEKNHLDLGQVHNCSNMFPLVVFHWVWHL